MAISVRNVVSTLCFFYLIFGIQADVCPHYFKQIGEKCYYVSTEKANWHVAFRKCGAIDSNLLIFENELEKTSVTEYLLQLGVPLLDKWADSVWIGMNTLGLNRTFVVAHNGAPMPYLIWLPTQPDLVEQECVAYTGYKGYGYHDYTCSVACNYVCETRTKSSLIEPKTSNSH